MWSSLVLREEQVHTWARLMALACALQLGYAASRLKGASAANENAPYTMPRPPQLQARPWPDMARASGARQLTAGKSSGNLVPGPAPGLPPGAREWRQKELRGFREAQERKWRRWAEAMFEPRS